MRALVFNGPWDLTIEDRNRPEAAPGTALLRVLATGICGSDLHGFTGENGRRHPGQVMGHETVAVVEHDPSGGHAPGALVTVNPVIGCRSCRHCAAGQTQKCPNRRVIGVDPRLSSAFAEYFSAPADNLVELPDGTPAQIGALVEPLAVGYHAARRADVATDESVLVIGGGPIGQAAALAARRLGAAVTVSEPDQTRRDVLTTLGFATVDPTVAQPAPATADDRFDVVLDAVGTSQTLSTALTTSWPGSRIVLVGMNAPLVELSAYAISTEERTILGSFCYDVTEFRDTAHWAAQHADLLAGLIDTEVDLAAAPATFTALARGDLRAGKVLVRIGAADWVS